MQLEQSKYFLLPRKHSMNLMLSISVIYLSSCSNPIAVYKFEDDNHHIILKLYNDSTFIEKVEGKKDSYEYSGNWKGVLKEDSTFTTVATKKGYQILTLTPIKIYRIKTGSAVQIINRE
jgi:hypothetical protein